MRERLIVGGDELVSGFDLLGWGRPTATLASEMQPAEKGRITSLSILCLIILSSSNATFHLRFHYYNI